jgi:hypothetical protein
MTARQLGNCLILAIVGFEDYTRAVPGDCTRIPFPNAFSYHTPM